MGRREIRLALRSSVFTNIREHSTPYLNSQVFYSERSKIGFERSLGGLNGAMPARKTRNSKAKTPRCKYRHLGHTPCPLHWAGDEGLRALSRKCHEEGRG